MAQQRSLKREWIENVIRTYFDGCNEANIEKMLSCFVPDARHYFPRGAPQGPFLSARAIAEGWKRAVETWGSYWTIDVLLIDEVRNEAAMEWTHFKTRTGLVLRGAELYWPVSVILTKRYDVPYNCKIRWMRKSDVVICGPISIPPLGHG
jgi:SnoaL-like protein